MMAIGIYAAHYSVAPDINRAVASIGGELSEPATRSLARFIASIFIWAGILLVMPRRTPFPMTCGTVLATIGIAYGIVVSIALLVKSVGLLLATILAVPAFTIAATMLIFGYLSSEK